MIQILLYHLKKVLLHQMIKIHMRIDKNVDIKKWILEKGK
jgi:hypothetical protein